MASLRYLLLLVGSQFIIACGDTSSTPREKPWTEKVTEDAYKLCEALTGTKQVSTCEVKGWDMSVVARIDTSGKEAIKICDGIALAMAKQPAHFDGKWTLKILSPFSQEQALAVCTLY